MSSEELLRAILEEGVFSGGGSWTLTEALCDMVSKIRKWAYDIVLWKFRRWEHTLGEKSTLPYILSAQGLL